MRNHETKYPGNIGGEVKKESLNTENKLAGAINIDSLVDAHMELNCRQCIFH